MVEWLRDRRVLLVLDNFEQVIDAGPIVADLLRAADGPQGHRHQPGRRCTSRASRSTRSRACPRRRTRATCRARSGCSLPGASRGVDPGTLSQYAAVRLFIERAVAVKPGFAVTNDNAPAVAAISARLHGMPLAIELAAARIKLLSPDAILARLEHQLDVLAAGSRDLPARQQTLRGAIAWSYDLLDEGGAAAARSPVGLRRRLRPRVRGGDLRAGLGARRRPRSTG